MRNIPILLHSRPNIRTLTSSDFSVIFLLFDAPFPRKIGPKKKSGAQTFIRKSVRLELAQSHPFWASQAVAVTHDYS
jgi:hypothetical protein